MPHPNTKAHDKGIIGECTYYQISLSKPMKDHPNRLNGFGIPMHRLVYVWFNDIIKAYNDNDEKMEICHIDGDSSNNHITNLTWDTAKNNRAMRRGAVNQYGERKEKYGKDLLHEKIWADPTKKH